MPEPKIEKSVKIPVPGGLTLSEVRSLAEMIEVPASARVAYSPGSQLDPGGYLTATWSE